MKYVKKNQLVVFLIIAILTVAGLFVWNSVQSKGDERVIVENKTHLIVEEVKDLGIRNNLNVFEISLKNDYDRPISLYRLRVFDESTRKNEISAVEKGGLTDGWVLKPDETSSTIFSAAQKGKVFLTVAALLFEDGGGDGSINDLNRLEENRAGVMMGFQKILPIFREAASTDKSTAPERIREFGKRIERLDDADIPDNSRPGFRLAKDYLTREFHDIENKAATEAYLSFGAEMTTKLIELDARLVKLERSLPSNMIKRGQPASANAVANGFGAKLPSAGF